MKRTLFLGLAATALVLGAGVAAGYSLSNAPIEAKAADEVYYTLTPAAGTNNNYGSNCDISIAPLSEDVSNTTITWNVTGNSQYTPWRIGGKSLSGVDRAVYSKTAMPETITKAEITLGTASSVTINSASFIVASDASFENVVDTVSLGTSIASKTTTIAPSTGKTWSSGSYYKFNFNITISSTSNKFVQFSGVKFYHAAAEGVALKSVTAADVNVKLGDSKKIGLTFDPSNASNRDVTYEVNSGTDVASVDEEGNVTGLKVGTAVVTITPSDKNASATTCTVTVEDHPEIDVVEVGKKYAIYGTKASGVDELKGIGMANTTSVGLVHSSTGDVPSCNYPFTVVNGVYKNTVAFRNEATGKYLEYHDTGNALYEVDDVTRASSWTIVKETVDEADLVVVRNIADRTRVLSYNSTNPRFACYNTTNQNMVQFFKIEEVALTDFTIDETLEVRKGLTATIGVEYDPANASDKTLTWTSSDETVATVDSDGVVTGVELGTAVIKASKTIGETKVERSCTVTVTKTLNHAGTLDDPYDVADAKILGDHPTVGNVENVYVKGFFTKFYTNSPTTSNCSIWIGDELTQTTAATGAFEFYKIAGLDENSLAALKIGATIIGKGNITKYNTTYEFGEGCTIEYNSYAEALGFGGDFISDLATICAVTKDSASGEAPAQLKTAWGTLATAYGNLSEVEQAHIISATADEAGDNLEKAVALYDYAVAKYTDLDKFITTRVSSLGNLSNNRVSNDHNNAAWIIVAVLGVSAIVAGSVVIIAKKRRAE